MKHNLKHVIQATFFFPHCIYKVCKFLKIYSKFMLFFVHILAALPIVQVSFVLCKVSYTNSFSDYIMYEINIF